MKSWKKEFLKEWWKKYPDYLPLGARWRGLWQKGQVNRIIKELDERQLDIQIAQQVFVYMVNVKELTEYQEYGGQIEYPELMYLAEVYDDGSGERWELLPHYSTDIKDAFLIVDHMKQKFNSFLELNNEELKQTAKFYKHNEYYRSFEDTAELAICNAAIGFKFKV